ARAAVAGDGRAGQLLPPWGGGGGAEGGGQAAGWGSAPLASPGVDQAPLRDRARPPGSDAEPATGGREARSSRPHAGRPRHGDQGRRGLEGVLSMNADPTSAAAVDTSQPDSARRAATEAGAKRLSQFVSFAIGDDQYGVDIMAVREIKGWSQVTHLPGQPDYMRGVLNLRGVMVPIIDLRCRFGQGMTEATPLHVVIVVQIDGRHVGMLA